MHWLWWILIGIGIILILLPFIKIKIFLSYFHKKDDDHLEVKISTLLGLIKYTIKVPLLEVDDDTASIIVKEEEHSAMNNKERTEKITPREILHDLRKIKDFIRHVVGLHTIVRNFFKKVCIDTFSWSSWIGTGDAALTGTIVGAAWAIKGSTLGVISNYMKLKKSPKIEVFADFQKLTSQTELQCMISFRLGHAIVAAIQIIKHWKKRPLFTKDHLYEQNGI